jgi:hypothetical protein
MPFAKGKPRPAGAGRRKGTPNHGTERARRLISEEADKEIVDKVIEAAKLNDPDARRIYFRHLRPPLPRVEAFIGPIDYTAPTTPEEARVMILVLGGRLARSEISLEAHNALLDNLKAYLGDKAAEQERRLSELENAFLDESMENDG